MWLVHREGFSLGTVIPENMGGKRGSELSRQTSILRGGRESYKVKLHSGQVLEADEEDVEKVNKILPIYRIRGIFGSGFNLAIWQIM